VFTGRQGPSTTRTKGVYSFGSSFPFCKRPAIYIHLNVSICPSMYLCVHSYCYLDDMMICVPPPRTRPPPTLDISLSADLYISIYPYIYIQVYIYKFIYMYIQITKYRYRYEGTHFYLPYNHLYLHNYIYIYIYKPPHRCSPQAEG